jgi:hypothetical protein
MPALKDALDSAAMTIYLRSHLVPLTETAPELSVTRTEALSDVRQSAALPANAACRQGSALPANASGADLCRPEALCGSADLCRIDLLD